MSSEWSEFTQSWDTPDDAQAAWPISALLITNSSELIYAGDTSGRLTTYTLGRPGEALERYTSFLCAHTAIRRMHALGRSTSGSVLVQTDDSVQVRTRGGAKAFGKSTTPNEPFTASAVSGLEAFVCTAAGGGTLLDIERGSVVRRAAVDASAVAADLNGACLTLATAQGLVVCRDARAGLGVAQTARAFPGGGAVDMVRSGARIFVCGTGPDPANAYRLLALPTVRVFDVRNLAQPLEDIDCGDGAAPVRLWAGGDDLWICHDSGYVETRSARDAWTTPGDAFAEPALSDYAYASAFCVAPTGDAALVADTDGVLHVWAAGEAPLLSEKAALRDGDFDCSAEMPALGVDFDCDSVSLMCVEMPAARAPLLSWMDGERLYDVGRPARFVDAGVLGSLRQMDGVGYVANPRTARRNQQVFGRAWRQRWGDGAQDDGELTLGRSKFLSQQRRRTHASPQQPDAAELPPVPESQAQQPQQQQSQPPKQLQRMRISYSRFGVEDFDFSLYNATAHSGLEGGRDNAYANALLQTLFRSPELRSVVLAHSAGDCTEPQCLSCQMGFLFRSLETAAGASCHATQLLHVLADRPEAAALALLEDEHGNPASGTSYAVLAQRLLRFLLEQASGECAGLTAGANGRAVERIVGFAQDTHTACPQCHAMRSRSSHVFAADLDPPQGTSGLATLLAGGSVSVRRAEMLRSGRRTGILALIEQALARSETTRAWCPECRSFQLLQTEKHMTQAPAGYFALNFPVIEPSADAAGGSSGSGSGSGSGGGAWQTSLPAEFRLVVGGAAGKRISVLPAC
ncbi:poly(A)-specific ribonuclease, partial [Kickxella alabastrina]